MISYALLGGFSEGVFVVCLGLAAVESVDV